MPATNGQGKIALEELGSAGVLVSSGAISDRYTAAIQGPAGLTTMAMIMRQEPAAFTLHNAILLTALQATWTAAENPAGKTNPKAIEHVTQCLDDMSHPFSTTVAFLLSAAPFGFADVEIVYKRRDGQQANGKNPASLYKDGLIGWKKFGPRRQETIEKWTWDENGGVQGMIQTDPATGKQIEIPIDKLLHVRLGDDRGNWEGLGWLEPAWKLWRMIENLTYIYGIGQQRAHVGLPVFKFVAKPDPSTLDEVKRMGKGLIVNEQQFVYYPGNVVEFDLKTVSNPNANTLKADIDQLRWEIMMLGMASFFRLGTTASGSRALADPLVRMFLNGVNGMLDAIADVFSRHAIPRLLAANPNLKSESPPLLQHSKVSGIPVEIIEMLEKVKDFVGEPSMADKNWLRTMLNMPVAEEQPEGGEDTSAPGQPPAEGKAAPTENQAATETPAAGARQEQAAPAEGKATPAEPAKMMAMFEAAQRLLSSYSLPDELNL